MNSREKLFSFLLSFYFYLFWLFFFLFLHFRCYSPNSWLSFFHSIPFKNFLSSHLLLLNHLSLFLWRFFLFVILIFLLLLIVFVLFYLILPVIDVCQLFSFILSFIWNFVLLWYPFSFPISLYFILRFPFLKVTISFLFHSFKTSSHSHREILTNMHDAWQRNEVKC